MRRESRRKFIKRAGAAGSLLALGAAGIPYSYSSNASGKLALLGGKPVRTGNIHDWPIWDSSDESGILPVLRGGVWSRAEVVSRAERLFADKMGTRRCLLTTNGTNALITSLRALGVEGGDEVITTPYTFVATLDAICLNNALPVFVDIDPVTWQINPDKIEGAITGDTKVLLPVHILGGLSHMDKINAIARKHDLRVVEDACEAHLAEWKGQKAGSLGDLGCFSLQNGKQLTCGEGGAIIGNDERIMDLCLSFHDFGRAKGKYMPRDKGASPILGTKCRMSEYQASILMTQMESLEEETNLRSKNASSLSRKLAEIPGIIPRENYAENNRDSHYYYGFRFKEEEFGFTREVFIKALKAEGIPADAGLGVIEGGLMHQEGVFESVLNSKTYRKLYPKARLDSCRENLYLPEAEQLVRETVGIKHQNLLGGPSDIEDIWRAVLKVYENRESLRKV